jgi:hypothetical protein
MTILATPEDYSSAHGDLIYTVYDPHAADSATYPNYKYIADVYIEGERIARIRKLQDPITGIGIFNIGELVRSYITTQFNPSPDVLLSQILGEGEFYVSVLVVFGEEYGYVSYVDIISDSIRKFYNYYNTRTTTTAISGKVGELATNNPLIGYALLLTSHYLITYMASVGAGTKTVTVTPVGGGEAFSTSFPWVGGGMHVLNISPVVLNAIHPGAITSATKYYTVELESQTYRINLICEPLYETYAVHFMNQYGVFETKLFSKVSRKKYKIEKKDFGKLNYTVDSSGIVSYKNSNNVYNESRSVYSVLMEEKLTLNSDFITNEEYLWLAELIFSPMVYLQDGSNFYPVVISETDYEPKKVINDDLTNLTITLEFGQTLNAQFR